MKRGRAGDDVNGEPVGPESLKLTNRLVLSFLNPATVLLDGNTQEVLRGCSPARRQPCPRAIAHDDLPPNPPPSAGTATVAEATAIRHGSQDCIHLGERPPAETASHLLPLFISRFSRVTLRPGGASRTSRSRRSFWTGFPRHSGSAIFPGWARRSSWTFKASGQADRSHA